MKNTVTINSPDVSLGTTIKAATQISQRLGSLANTLGPSHAGFQFYTRTRVKSKQSIREKTIRKRNDPLRSKAYSYHDMTDILGFRIVTLYDFQLVEAQSYILSLVESGQALPQSLFIGESISDALIEAQFYAQSSDDDYHTCHEALLDGLRYDATEGSQDELRDRLHIETASKDLYSSAHLIFEALAYENGFCLRVPIEFQIRTAVEDVWAEVNHKMLYKLRDPSAWSLDFERYYIRAKKRSKDLKKATRKLARCMKDFSDQSEAATRSLNLFNSAKDLEQAERSFGISLIIRSSSNSLDTRISNLLPKYSDALSRLSDTPLGSGDAISNYDSAFSALREISKTSRALLDEQREELESALEASIPDLTAKLTSTKQVREICKLEALRLRSSAVLEDIVLIDGAFGSSSSIARDTNDRLELSGEEAYSAKLISSQECTTLYAKMCDHLDSSKPKVRPGAVTLFWKYLISLKFSRHLSFPCLKASYEALQTDMTVQEYSIYRARIPRALASFYCSEVNEILKSFDGLDRESADSLNMAESISSLRSTLSFKVIDAIKYALEAGEAMRDGEINGGDFRLGFEAEERLEDETLIQKCIELANNGLGLDLDELEPQLSKRVSTFIKKV